MHPLNVYKKLPQINCGKCSARTCMAFAVQFLGRMIPLAECPELDDSAREEIGAMLSNTGDWKEQRLKELFNETMHLNISGIAEGLGAQFENGSLILRYPLLARG
jgi:CO dehydrogenase/acetyl-CoA synthase gamma subunit (corrinoid Fe-S protein)